MADEDVLTRLMRGLETKKTLYHVKDYPGVELKQLNHYVKKLGPLVNPVFDEQSAFFIDEGRFIPYRMVAYGNEKVAAEIGAQLRNWSKCSGEGVRYCLDDNGDVQCSGNSVWRDLDGGDVLPGFRIRSVVLEMALNQDLGSSSEEEVDFACPERGCTKRFRSRGAWTAHAEWHREERAIAKYLES
ncbi:Zinc finger C2H2-type/integrase DNA-binding domain [Phytophthora cactorum]|nr:Zinc finger C2H2-type/integrase DNA-binding domain [Phytophthora cactorum]